MGQMRDRLCTEALVLSTSPLSFFVTCPVSRQAHPGLREVGHLRGSRDRPRSLGWAWGVSPQPLALRVVQTKSREAPHLARGAAAKLLGEEQGGGVWAGSMRGPGPALSSGLFAPSGPCSDATTQPAARRFDEAVLPSTH